MQFSPNGYKIITASSDRTCRLWSVETGECLQVLEGHSDEIFSCACLREVMACKQVAIKGFGCVKPFHRMFRGCVGCFKVPSTMRVTL